MDEINELSRRLERLERRERLYRHLLILMVVIACATALLAQDRFPAKRPETDRPAAQPAQEGTIRAEAFILTDAKGTERASLVTDGNGSVFLVMFDRNGRARADLQVNNYGPSLNFYDPNSKTRAVIGSTDRKSVV